jgi:hypothetical protein
VRYDRYGGVQKGGGWASLYFLSLVIFGNYVVLNIFLAIAVESLETVQVCHNLVHHPDRTADVWRYTRILTGHPNLEILPLFFGFFSVRAMFAVPIIIYV